MTLSTLSNGTKVCRCKLRKPLSAFHPSKDAAGGVNTRCNDCHSAYYRDYYAKIKADPERWRKHISDRREYKRKHRKPITDNNRNSYLLLKYGISLEDYERRLEQQGNKCLICGYEPSGSNKWTEKLVVDHCHKTGRVRGLLCNKCNAALGYMADDPENLRRATEYLEEHSR